MAADPTFSIIIPTRNRAGTLKSALRTCLEVDYPNFEVVVSDNDSSDNTPEVVAAFNDSRVRYFRTSDYLSMGSNFESGLQHSRGQFLIFIGDDDGIMPFALRVLELAYRRYRTVDYINWHHNGLFWPHAKETAHSLNWLSNLGRVEVETPVQTWRRISKPRSTDSNEMNGYNLYHACIRRTAIDKATAAGVKLFASLCPDVASGIRILRFAQNKLLLPVALTSIGVSHKSNSLSNRAVRKKTESDAQRDVLRDFVTMNARDYPDAALTDYALVRLHRGIAFLSPLIDEHLGRHGDLHELDTDMWRMIFMESIMGTDPNELGRYTDDFNEIAAWMHERGATGQQTLSPADIGQTTGNDRLPRFYNLPFRFSDGAVAEARNSRGEAAADDAGGRILSIYQEKGQLWLKVRAVDDEFTIYDHIRVTNAVLSGLSEDLAQLLVEDPAIFQARAVMSVLSRFAR